MKISAKTDYALRTLCFLTDCYRGAKTAPVSIRAIAEKNEIPRRFLEQIMIDLRENGWVKSVAGRDGGFVLARSPETITMGDVIRFFDESMTVKQAPSHEHASGTIHDSKTRFRGVLRDIRDYATAKLDATSLASVSFGPVTERRHHAPWASRNDVRLRRGRVAQSV